ncbi:uncharacterized protein [Tursiops truncatus]|uniref:uncharacterized protein n=1 Tax=Tursiops truncatus TaxID=9739 RepID=UPI003CCF15BC
MLKMAMKIKAWAVESERKTALAAAEVAAEAAAVAAALAEPRAPRKKGDTEKPPKKPEQEASSEKLLTEKERRKIERKLLEQRRNEEKKKEKERKKLEKMQKKKKKKEKKKKKKKVPEAQEEARGLEVAAATAAGGADEGAAEGADGGGVGAGAGATSRIWIEWDTDSSDEDDLFDALRGFRGAVWGSGLLKISALSAHLPLLTFPVLSVRSPAWVLDFLLQKRPEQGRGCGFFFGAICCFRMFLGCAFFSFVGGRAKRRGHGRPGTSGAFGSGHGAQRQGREERLI